MTFAQTLEVLLYSCNINKKDCNNMKFIEQEFPSQRFRRNRKSEKIRNLISETNISTNDLIWPVFICEGNNVEQNVPSMPGVKEEVSTALWSSI